MGETIEVKLESVPKTLLLPLWGRAVETKKANPNLRDQTAVEILSQIEYDFSTIAQKISELSRMAWIARSLFFDHVIAAYLKDYPHGTVVNIGCGLDTTFERIDNGAVQWFDLDLPEVIELRRCFIPENNRRRSLAYNVFNSSWFDEVPQKASCLFMFAGVLYYFNEDDVKRLLLSLLGSFPGCQMVFDYASPQGVRIANKKVIDDGGMDQSAYLQWGIKNAHILEKWSDHIKVITDQPMFKDYKKKVDFVRKIGTSISDAIKVMSLAHIKTS